MAIFLIGDEHVDARLLNFEKLQAAWPHFDGARQLDITPVQRAAHVISLVAICTMPPDWEDNPEGHAKVEVEARRLRRTMRPDQMFALVTSTNELMIECGLAQKGEDQPAGETASPSAATSDPSSISSSQPAAEPSETSASTGA